MARGLRLRAWATALGESRGLPKPQIISIVSFFAVENANYTFGKTNNSRYHASSQALLKMIAAAVTQTENTDARTICPQLTFIQNLHSFFENLTGRLTVTNSDHNRRWSGEVITLTPLQVQAVLQVVDVLLFCGVKLNDNFVLAEEIILKPAHFVPRWRV